jgi:hypothetical protein
MLTFTASASSSVASSPPYDPLPSLHPFFSLRFLDFLPFSYAETSLATLALGLIPGVRHRIPVSPLATPPRAGDGLGYRTRDAALCVLVVISTARESRHAAPPASLPTAVSTCASTNAEHAPPPQPSRTSPPAITIANPAAAAATYTYTCIRAFAPELHRALAPAPPAIAQLAGAPLVFHPWDY